MLKRGIEQFLFYKTSMGSNMKTVQAQAMEENRKSAIVWAAAQLLYWLYCLIMSTRAPDFLMCRSIYLIAFAICALALVLAVFAAPRAPWLIRPICIAVDVALLGAGIGIARLLAPKTIIIFASVLIVPVFFICDTLSTIILLVLNAAAFAAIGAGSMEAETFRWTLTNQLIFSSVGLVLGYFVNRARFERYSYAESAVQLAALQNRYAYYDQMTGLQNRRAYAEKIDQFLARKPSDCCVVMVDIDGLKEMNDTRGHEAGDELIIGAAECLRESFPDTELIYRIGGDEFCVLMNGPAEHVEECLKQLEEAGSRWEGELVSGLSISCGYASDKEFDDFDSMLKAADQRMYAAKSDYYSAADKDRRLR